MSSPSDHWPLRHGPTVPVAVVRHLLDMESRGVVFTVTETGVDVRPAALVTPADIAFLRAHRDDVRAIVAYDPPVEHLL